MTSGHSQRHTAATTTAAALLLSLFSAPAAAAPLQERDPVTSQILACPDGRPQVQPAPGWESMYALRVNGAHNCAELTNVSASTDPIYGRVLLLRGERQIAGPLRDPNLGGATHWVRQTAATAAEEVLAEQGVTGWEVILPGESVSYEWYSPTHIRHYAYEVPSASCGARARIGINEPPSETAVIPARHLAAAPTRTHRAAATVPSTTAGVHNGSCET